MQIWFQLIGRLKVQWYEAHLDPDDAIFELPKDNVPAIFLHSHTKTIRFQTIMEKLPCSWQQEEYKLWDTSTGLETWTNPLIRVSISSLIIATTSSSSSEIWVSAFEISDGSWMRGRPLAKKSVMQPKMCGFMIIQFVPFSTVTWMRLCNEDVAFSHSMWL